MPGGAAASRRFTSWTVSGISPGSGGGGWLGLAGGGRLGVGAVPELGGGYGADREGGHDEDDVPEDRGVEASLALVEAEVVLAELESFLDGPSQPTKAAAELRVGISRSTVARRRLHRRRTARSRRPGASGSTMRASEGYRTHATGLAAAAEAAAALGVAR